VALSAILGYFAGWRDRTTGALLASALVTALFCFGLFTPLLRWIPVANKVREVNWWSCYAVTVLFALGSYGLQQLLDAGAAEVFRGHFRRVSLGVLLTGLVAVLWLIPAMHVKMMVATALSFCLSFALLAVCLLFPAQTRKFHSLVAVAVVFLGLAVPVLSYARFRPSQSMLMDAEHVQTRAEALRIAAYITDGEDYRFAVSPDIGNYKNFTVTLASLGLRGIRGDISPQEYDKFRLLFFPSPAVANLYGVKYQVVPAEPSAGSDIRIDDKISLQVNQRALPRLFFVQGGVQVVESPVDALMGAPAGGMVHVYVAREDLPSGFEPGEYPSDSTTLMVPTLLENGSVHVQAIVETRGSGLLVLNEDMAGRWRATIDGKQVRSFRVNGFQTAFLLSGAGLHMIEVSRPGLLL
jgi:hypothetical protein